MVPEGNLLAPVIPVGKENAPSIDPNVSAGDTNGKSPSKRTLDVLAAVSKFPSPPARPTIKKVKVGRNSMVLNAPSADVLASAVNPTLITKEQGAAKWEAIIETHLNATNPKLAGGVWRKMSWGTDEEKKEFNTHVLLAVFVGSGKGRGPGGGLRKEDNTPFQPSYLAKLEYQCEFFLQTQWNKEFSMSDPIFDEHGSFKNALNVLVKGWRKEFKASHYGNIPNPAPSCHASVNGPAGAFPAYPGSFLGLQARAAPGGPRLRPDHRGRVQHHPCTGAFFFLR